MKILSTTPFRLSAALVAASVAGLSVTVGLHAASANNLQLAPHTSSAVKPSACGGHAWTWPFDGCGTFAKPAIQISNSGDGIDASSASGSAGKFTNTSTTNGNAPVYATTASTNSAVYAVSVGALGNVQQGAVTAFSTNGNGVYGFSQNASGGAFESSAGNGIAALYVQADNTNGDLFYAVNKVAGGVAYIDPKGNMVLSGNLYTSGPCHSGCATASDRVVSYATRESVPTMEDVGEGQLTNGVSRIRIDSAFATTTDLGAGYDVFVSPGGPNRGLYVSQKSAAGFTVAENPGGRSTIPFSYRIVAKPYGVSAQRLPVIHGRR